MDKFKKNVRFVCFFLCNTSLIKLCWIRSVSNGEITKEITINQQEQISGKIVVNKDEVIYMKNNKIDITVSLGKGSKKFTAYTMDLTHNYVKINSDYRS